MIAIVARMLGGLLLRSAWLLPPDRAEWLEGLIAEAAETRSGRGRVIWLLGGAGLIARELLRQSVVRVLGFVAGAGIVVWVVWPGSSADDAVGVNRIVVPALLVVLALLPLLVRRFYGPRYWMLDIAPIPALFAGLLGIGVGDVSLRIGNRHDSPPSAELSAPAST